MAAVNDIKAIYLEYTDLLNHFRGSRTPSGIQRVQIELFEASQQSQTPIPIFSCAYNDNLKWWVLLDPCDFTNLLTLACEPGEISDKDWGDFLARIEATSTDQKCQFQKNSVLINFGVLWRFTHYMDAIREAKSLFGLRYVATIYDLIPTTRPDLFFGNRMTFNYWMSLQIMLADQFIVISTYTMTEFIKAAEPLKPIIEPLILMPLNGRHKRLAARQPEHNRILDRLQQGRDFILFVSTIEERKNHVFAFQAWLKLILRHEPAEIPALICIGKFGWNGERALQFLQEQPDLMSKILLVNDVSDGELDALYKNCLLTIYPSRYEGWGLPVCESLSYGKACISADNTSLPESGGTLADLYKSNSIDDFLAKLELYIFDRSALRRRELEISSSYTSRSWCDIFDHMLDDVIDRLCHSSSYESGIAKIKLGQIYGFSKQPFENGLSREAAISEMICHPMHWETADLDGVWSRKSPSQLTFLADNIRSDLLMYIQVRAPDLPVELTIIFQGRPVLKTGFQPSQNRILRLLLPVTIAHSIRDDEKPFQLGFQAYHSRDNTRSFTSLCLHRFMICHADDLESQLNFIESRLIRQ